MIPRKNPTPQQRWLWKRCRSPRLGLSKGDQFLLFESLADSMPEVCPVLGIRLNYWGATKQYAPDDSYPSLDRVFQKNGYVPGNVEVISYRANRVKNDGTAKEHALIWRYMRNNLRKRQSAIAVKRELLKAAPKVLDTPS